MENLFLPMICTSCLNKGISGMQFSMQIWTRESQAACLAHEKHVQIVGNSKIYFTILIYFYHHIVALRCVAVRMCAKQAAWDSRVQICIENCIPEMPLSRQLVQIIEHANLVHRNLTQNVVLITPLIFTLAA